MSFPLSPARNQNLALVGATASVVCLATGLSLWWWRRRRRRQQRRYNNSTARMTPRNNKSGVTKRRLAKLRRHMAIQKAAIENRTTVLAKDASGIITMTKNKLEWDLIDWESKVKVLNELAALDHDEKLEALFEMLDADENGNIDAYELMEQRRKYSSFQGIYTDLEESLRFATRQISSFDQDGDSMLNMEEFKALVFHLAQKQADKTSVPEMCEILVFSLLFENPESLENDEDGADTMNPEQEAQLEQAIHQFSENHHERLGKIFDLFEKDENEMIEKAHALFLISAASAHFSGAHHLRTIDDFDFGSVDYGYFVQLVFGALSTQDEQPMAFFDCIHSTMIQLAASGIFDASSLTNVDSAALIVAETPSAVAATEMTTTSESTVQDETITGQRAENAESPPPATTAAVRSSRILHAAAMIQSTLQQADTNGVSDFVRISKSLLEMQILSHRQKLKLMQEFRVLDESDRVVAVFNFLDLDGEGKIDALELADGLRRFVGVEHDFAAYIRLAIDTVTKFDSDGDCMLDVDEFRTYVQDFADSIEQTFNVACEIFMMKILLSERDAAEDDLAEYSIEKITEEVKLRERIQKGKYRKHFKTLFGLLDIDACDSITSHEAVVAIKKVVELVPCEKKNVLDDWLVHLHERDCRLDREEFLDFTVHLVMSCSPSDPLSMFDALVNQMTACLLRELVPDEYKCAAAA